jgi:hypothetical protein
MRILAEILADSSGCEGRELPSIRVIPDYVTTIQVLFDSDRVASNYPRRILVAFARARWC